MKKNLFWALAISCALSASADEWPVSQFRYAGPFPMQQPFRVDSVDVHSKKFQPERWLEAPLSFAVLDKQGRSIQTLPGGDEATALHLARFVLENRVYTEAQLKVEGVEHYQLYVDGEKQKGKTHQLKLEPASHEVVLKYLSEAGKEGTPSVRVVCDKVNAMYNNLKNKQTCNYAPAGRAVVSRYPDKQEMLKEVYRQGPSKVSKHCADFRQLNVPQIRNRPHKMTQRSKR